MRILLLISALLLFLGQSTISAQSNTVAMAYVKDNSVWLADEVGNPLINTGPTIGEREGAKLFWDANGDTLYIATRSGLFVTSAEGGAAVRLPGEYGITVRLARNGGVIYNLDVENPQNIAENLIGFPLRETNIVNAGGGRGRLLAIIGEYQESSVRADVSHAAALYARDGGLVEGGRPQLWTTYGGSLFYSCCFPNPGMNVIDVGIGGDPSLYDASFIPGPAHMNATASRLAGPTTDGQMRVIDLISGGSRNYPLDASGALERVAWSIDEGAIYYITREAPRNPLAVIPTVTYPADTRSANLALWQLDLVSGSIRRVAVLGDYFGVSSIGATDDYAFATLITPNTALVNALNTGELAPDILPSDPVLNNYNPSIALWRIDLETFQQFMIAENTWGVVIRPR